MAKWVPGPKNVEKATNKPKKSIPFSQKDSVCWQFILNDVFEVLSDSVLPILVAKVSQIKVPWDHFSNLFVGMVEM